MCCCVKCGLIREPRIPSLCEHKHVLSTRRPKQDVEGSTLEVVERDILPVLPAIGGLVQLIDGGEVAELVSVDKGRAITVRTPPGGSVLCHCSAWDVCALAVTGPSWRT